MNPLQLRSEIICSPQTLEDVIALCNPFFDELIVMFEELVQKREDSDRLFIQRFPSDSLSVLNEKRYFLVYDKMVDAPDYAKLVEFHCNSYRELLARASEQNFTPEDSETLYKSLLGEQETIVVFLEELAQDVQRREKLSEDAAKYRDRVVEFITDNERKLDEADVVIARAMNSFDEEWLKKASELRKTSHELFNEYQDKYSVQSYEESSVPPKSDKRLVRQVRDSVKLLLGEVDGLFSYKNYVASRLEVYEEEIEYHKSHRGVEDSEELHEELQQKLATASEVLERIRGMDFLSGSPALDFSVALSSYYLAYEEYQDAIDRQRNMYW